MKNKIGWMTVAALGSLVAFGPMALSQEKKDDTTTTTPKSDTGRRPGGVAERLKQIAEELKLTDEQKGKLKPLLEDEAGKLRELRQDTGLSRADRQSKSKEIRNAANEKIKAILTPEQQEKWAKLRTQPRPRRGTQP